MAAVAAEPGAAAVPTTTTTAADDEAQLEPGPGGPVHPGTEPDRDRTREYTPVTELLGPRLEDGDGEERRHVRPELEPAAGKALAARASEEENAIISTDDELLSKYTVSGIGDRISMDRFSPVLGEREVGGTVQAVYRSIITDPQPSAVFLHSFPAHPPVTEAGLSLAEPAEPTTNVTTNRAEAADRSYTALLQPELRPEPADKAAGIYQDAAEDAILDGTVDRLSVPDCQDAETGYGKNCVGTQQNSVGTDELPGPVPPVARTLRDSSPPCRSPKRRPVETATLKQEKPGEPSAEPGSAEPGQGASSPGSVEQLSPGSEVRVSLDHVIDDALVVSFRVGEKVFSGVLMDLSKRFGPYGIPITGFPRRDYRDRPQPMQLQQEVDDCQSRKQEVVTLSAPPPPHPWTSKPPPLFQEGAPYPPPLFIRDTYNQALPQPPPRKIKRPKRRYRCEEPTSIMNAIKLRPRQVLCDKCKGVVTAGGPREARRGPSSSSEPRGEEASRRRRPADGATSSAAKRLRSDREEKGSRGAADRRPAAGIRVASSSSASSRRVLRGVSSSSSSSSSSRVRLKLNSKKVLAKGSAVERSKARQVLKKLSRSSQPPPPHRRPRENQNQNQNQNQDRPKAVTRAATLQSHNQKVHFTRRLQHLSGAAVGSGPHAALPPRMRLKPQRYRTDDSQASCSSSSSNSSPPKQSARTAPPKSALSPAPTRAPTPPLSQTPPPSSTVAPPCPPVPSSSSSSGVAVVAMEKQEEPRPPDREEEEAERRGAGGGGGQQVVDSSSSSSLDLDDLKSECSSTETFDLPPPGELLPLLPPPSSSSSSSSTPPPLPAPPEEARPRSSSSMFSKSVSKCSAPDGRTVCVGDIVWAKIYGFPWWPARVLGITVSRRGDTGLAVRQEARVSWFGSPTTSFLPLAQLAPFLESFQSRFDRKRKGPYRRAIAEAASAAKQLTPEVRALLTQFET
ncbi:PWWP domain-containing protein 2A [Centroberyx gerrardi]